jgi:hypothetical protein
MPLRVQAQDNYRASLPEPLSDLEPVPAKLNETHP